MTITTMQVQGSDGERHEVPLLQGADYDTPIYSLPEGAATSANQELASALLTSIASYLDTEVAAILAKLAAGLPADLGAGGGLKVEGFSGAYPFVTQPYSLAVARGLITGVGQINKFGAAPSGVQVTATDIWSRADATPTQQIWIAPTVARIHAIVSTSASDDGDPVGVGARTIRVYGLTSWDTAETSEVVTLNGTGAVDTANAYVIIHRMKVLTCGASGPNVGTISATAAVDGTVTAVILPGDGQTEMAIYGVPSTQTLILTRWGVGIDKASPTATTCDFELRVNENPNVQLLAFLRKDDMAVQSTGNQWQERTYGNPVAFPGPCIVKVQATASAADTDAKSGFDGYLVTK